MLNNLISNAIKFNREDGSVVVQALLHKRGEISKKRQKIQKSIGLSKKIWQKFPIWLLVAVTNSGRV